MSTYIRSVPSLRAAQSFHATASLTQPVRRLHITGAKDSPSQFLKPSGASRSTTRKSANEPRTFNTSRALKRPGDSSTIDFAFLPDAASLQPGMVSTAAMNIPILPDTYRATKATHTSTIAKSNATEDIPANIETVSAALPGQIAVLSEVEGATHEGREMEVFQIVENVGNSVAGSVKGAMVNVTNEAGTIKEIWEGMVGDLIHSRPNVA